MHRPVEFNFVSSSSFAATISSINMSCATNFTYARRRVVGSALLSSRQLSSEREQNERGIGEMMDTAH
eukprot:scaffold46906_cov15-Prasinocladus_malaysianus.AAC.1